MPGCRSCCDRLLDLRSLTAEASGERSYARVSSMIVSPISSGPRALLTAGALVIVIAGLRAASPIIGPVLFGLFLAVLVLPIVAWLERRGVPPRIAILLTVLAGCLVLVGTALLITASLGELSAAAPIYQVRMQRAIANALSLLQERGLVSAEVTARDLVRVPALFGFVGGTLREAVVLLADGILALLTMIFALLETAGLPNKMDAALGKPQENRQRFARVTREVQRYLGIKTLTSLATGIAIGAWVAFLGLDFPLLWGTVAFVCHFIPNIGAFLAAVPAVLLAVVQLGLSGASLVALGFVAVNMGLGNLIEPQLLGKRLGLSPLVVFLSLVFWGFVWGPVGMFLSVPLTMTLKILLENTPRLGWVAILLGPNPAPLPAEAPAPATAAE
jgi:AI-2 transport protein TqsA